jgi:indolepyruvate ferredoxin oxidoreductase alpha subunit
VEADIPMICKGLGIKEENIAVVNPLNLEETMNAIDNALSKDEPTVIIAKWPCVLKKLHEKDYKEFDIRSRKFEIDQDKCIKCKICVKTGCPAIIADETVRIIPAACAGCSICQQVCKPGAIMEVAE